MLLNEQAIYDNWAPLLESKSNIKDTNKLKWLSKYCHFHSLNEGSNINETFTYSSYATLNSIPGVGNPAMPNSTAGTNSFYTGATGSGDKFPSLLPLAIQVAARTVGFDIVPVIPIQGPVGILTYLDYHYAGGKIGSDKKPLMIKIDSTPGATFNGGAGAFTAGDKYWGVSDHSDGTNFAANTVKVVEMLFVGYSKIDGQPIFRIGSTGYCTGTGGNYTEDTTVTISQVFDGVESFIVMDNTNKPQVNNLATHTTPAITASAQLVRASEDHIQGFVGAGASDTDTWNGPWASGTNPAQPMSRGTGESTYYRSMGLSVFTKFIQAETFQAAASVTHEQIQDLNKQFGLNILNMIENALINEISQSINKHILSRAFALGWSNNAEMYKTESITLNFTLDRTVLANGATSYLNKLGFIESIPYIKYQDFGDFENLSTLQRRIKSKVLAAGNIIAQRGRRGPGNFVVTNLQLATALQDNAQYTFAPMNNNVNQDNGSLYPLGQIAGMTIYVDPNMRFDDNRILVGRKGADEEPGIKFCPYLMAESIQTISEATMSPKIAVKSRYALVEAGHWPETQYYTIYVHSGSMMLI